MNLKRFYACSVFSLIAFLSLTGAAAPPAAESAKTAEPTTAWKGGHFNLDVAGVVGRSDIILKRPNVSRDQALPLGNGRLGLGVWAEDGYTAQLNREDTWPKRLSPGHVVIPGLSALSNAHDFSARLDLYNGELIERGGGMTATTYVDPETDAMVVEVTGADPHAAQTAEIRLWAGRSPEASAEGKVGALSETWRDTNELGATGMTFGSLAAITADGLDVRAEAAGPRAAKISFRPKADGSFRILVASPQWTGGDAVGTGGELLEQAMKHGVNQHRQWWNRQWASFDLMKLSSADHAAEYFENLRVIDMFATVAESRDRFPGSQAGIADLFSSYKDDHFWGPSAWWHWNLRMQVSANFGAGMAAYNEPYFNLYNDNLDNIARWTKQHMNGRPGVCIPETMRFSGEGFENETWLKSQGISCSEDSRPYYNARTLSTGAEVALWVWQQYQYTDNRGFLESFYPLMRDSARFLLSYAKRDASGTLYTYPSNAHESVWDVVNPTTDVSAMHALFPAVVKAAQALNRDEDFVKQLQDAIAHLPALPERNPDQDTILKPGDPRDRSIIATSYTANPVVHNVENLGLEPVWPYSLIGDDGPMHEAGVRTYFNRPNKYRSTWSADPVQAARLGISTEVEKSLKSLTETYQGAISGMAFTSRSEFYVEQIGVVADALQTALVQDYDDLLRIAPAWPKGWEADGSVSIPHGARVYVQIHNGEVATVGIHAGSAQELKIRNPWKGHSVRVTDATGKTVATQQATDSIFTIEMQAGQSYLLEPSDAASTKAAFAPVTGTPATEPKRLGSRTIGLEAK